MCCECDANVLRMCCECVANVLRMCCECVANVLLMWCFCFVWVYCGCSSAHELLLVFSAVVVSSDGRGVQRRRRALRRRAAAHEVHLCVCRLYGHACPRALCTCVLSEASLRDDVIEWQSAWPILATTARGIQGALGRKAYCGLGAKRTGLSASQKQHQV